MYRRTPTGPQPVAPTSVVQQATMPQNTGRIEHAEIIAALASGTARTLSRTITDIARYRSGWWLFDRDEWIQVDDAALIADLDAAAILMADADHKVNPPKRTP